jgi:hypothetical protein
MPIETERQHDIQAMIILGSNPRLSAFLNLPRRRLTTILQVIDLFTGCTFDANDKPK